MKKLRLLYLPVEQQEGEQRARRKILQDMHQENRLEALEIFSYQIYGRKYGWKAMTQKIYETACNFQADAIYWHGLWEGDLDKNYMQQLLNLKTLPTLCHDNGDAFGNFWVNPPPKSLKQLSPYMDVCFSVGMGRQEVMTKNFGAKKVFLLPNAYDEVSFPDQVLLPLAGQKFDLVMIANRWRSRRPFASMPGVKARTDLVNVLNEEFGDRFALYGKGWDGIPCAHGPIDFFKQSQAFQQSKVAIGLPNFFDIDYYESNRPFNTIAAGIPYVSGYSQKFDQILKDGIHCHYFKTPQEAVDKVKWLLSLPEQEIIEMGRYAAEYVRKNHTVRNRVEIVISTLEGIWAHKHANAPFPEPPTSFFAH